MDREHHDLLGSCGCFPGNRVRPLHGGDQLLDIRDTVTHSFRESPTVLLVGLEDEAEDAASHLLILHLTQVTREVFDQVALFRFGEGPVQLARLLEVKCLLNPALLDLAGQGRLLYACSGCSVKGPSCVLGW